MSSKKQPRLARGEKWFIHSLSDTALRVGPTSACTANGLVHLPEKVTVALLLRVAENCYRRGFEHGAVNMRWHLYPESVREGHYDQPSAPGHDYAQRINDWRTRGLFQFYAKDEPAPDPHPSDPYFVVRGDGRVRNR